MFVSSLKLLPKAEETVTADHSSKGSSATGQAKKFKFLQCTKYAISAELMP